jgi:hypothetical protein
MKMVLTRSFRNVGKHCLKTIQCHNLVDFIRGNPNVGTWHLELLQTDFEGFLKIVMYHVVVLRHYMCEGRSFLLNHVLGLSTLLRICSGWQHCDFQIMICETT